MAHDIDWDDPVARLRLIESVGVDAYNAGVLEHRRKSVVEVVEGHEIRTVGSRFGRLYSVGATGTAYQAIDQARNHAKAHPISGVDRVTETDVFAACEGETLDGALARLMAIGGIETGDLAGDCFSDVDDGAWAAMSLGERADRIRGWLATEKAFLDAGSSVAP